MSRETLRRDIDNAAGEAFLPDGWQRIVRQVPALLAVADAAAAPYDPLDDAAFYRWQKNLADALAALEALP